MMEKYHEYGLDGTAGVSRLGRIKQDVSKRFGKGKLSLKDLEDVLVEGGVDLDSEEYRYGKRMEK